MGSIKNIARVYSLVDAVDRDEGMQSYARYNATLHRFAEHFGFGFVQVVAAFASLSPNNDYTNNVRSLVSLMAGIKKGLVLKQIKVSTYNHCRDRAYDILVGEKDFLAEVRGPKIRSFYMNIINPMDGRFVTIDGHMYSLWRGRRFRMKEVALGKFDYTRVARDFKLFARQQRLIPNQLQAMLWFTWKRIHNVKYDPQMSLLSIGDQWGLNVNPRMVKEFK